MKSLPLFVTWLLVRHFTRRNLLCGERYTVVSEHFMSLLTWGSVCGGTLRGRTRRVLW